MIVAVMNTVSLCTCAAEHLKPQVNCSQVEWLHSSVGATGNPDVAGSNFVEVLLMSAPLNKLRL